MIFTSNKTASRSLILRFRADNSGATMVELAIVLPLFLLIFFGLIDFGRMAFHYVTAEKAMQVAARVAAVRPPACAGVALTNVRGVVAPTETPPKYGSLCSSGATVCGNPGTVSCTASLANATVDEIWGLVGGALPIAATPANLLISYSFDPNLGFLGGPYVPIVTVEIQDLDFEFISPLSALAGLAIGAEPDGLGADISFPSMSVSVPAEDLAKGEAG